MSINQDNNVTDFQQSLAALDVDVTYTAPAAFAETLASIVQEETIGVPLPFDSISQPEWIDTEVTPAKLNAAQTSVTPASLGIADYGSVVLDSTTDGAEQISLFVDLHIPVLSVDDIVQSMADAIDQIGPKLRAGGSSIIATGPSATADMGALVKGAHGPKDVHVIVLTDETDGGNNE
ncbi:LUD domain-containing protein [Halorubraceae archaeon YAN]|nr:LUD domain-containing protein [Halorubraceae archaeon YAN]